MAYPYTRTFECYRDDANSIATILGEHLLTSPSALPGRNP